MEEEENVQELLNRASNAFNIKEYSLAEELLKSLLQDSENYHARILLGAVYGETEHYVKSIREFLKALELDPESHEALNNLGIMYKKNEEYEAAVKTLLKAINLAPDRPDLYYNLGNVYKLMNRVTDAEKAYKTALKKDPSFIQPYNNLGTIYEARKEYDRAIELYNRGLNIDQNNPSLLYNRGVAHLAKGSFETAESDFVNSLKRSPDWDKGLNNLALSLQQQKKEDEALELFNKVIEINPENKEAENNIAVLLIKKGEMDQAEEHLKSIIKRNPSYLGASRNLQKLYEKKNDHGKSLEELNKLLNLDPANIHIKEKICGTLINLKRFEEAEKTLEHILVRNRDNPEAFRLKAILFAETGRENSVDTVIQDLLHLHPTENDIFLYLAKVFLKNGDYPRAESNLGRYLKRNPDDREALFKLAELKHKQGHSAEAVRLLEPFRDSVETSDLIYILADAYTDSGNETKALDLLNNEINMDRLLKPEDLDNFTKTLEQYEKAVENFEKSGRFKSSNVEALQKWAQTVYRENVFNFEDFLFDNFPVEDDDSISIIDIGGMEPVIQINEPEEILWLEESLEDFSDLDEYTELYEEEKLDKPDQSESSGPAAANQQMPRNPQTPYLSAPQSVQLPPITIIQQPLTQPQVVNIPNIQIQQPAAAPDHQKTPEPELHDLFHEEEEMELIIEDEILDEPEPEPEPEHKEGDLLGLMHYLQGLTDYMNENAQKKLDEKDITLKMAKVTSKLEGKHTLTEIGNLYDRRKSMRDIDISDEKLYSSFSFLTRMSADHPDNKVKKALLKKMDHLLHRIKTENEES